MCSIGAADLPHPEYDCPVFEWTEKFGRFVDTIPHLIAEVGSRFQACGMPLARIGVIVRTLHPQIAVTGYSWHSSTGNVREFTGDHESQSRESYQRSPVRVIFEGSPGIRRRLLDPDCPRDYPILDDLAGEGITDYVMFRCRSPTGKPMPVPGRPATPTGSRTCTSRGSCSSCRPSLWYWKSWRCAPSRGT